MAKNLMLEIIKMLGVGYGEKFKICGVDQKRCEPGLLYFDEKGRLMWISSHDEVSEANDNLFNILSGYYEIVKLPWEPTVKDNYFYPSISRNRIIETHWDEDTDDYALKSLGVIYRTREDAEAHYAEDYERLTGKKLE